MAKTPAEKTPTKRLLALTPLTSLTSELAKVQVLYRFSIDSL